jgi:hypothetical protein
VNSLPSAALNGRPFAGLPVGPLVGEGAEEQRTLVQADEDLALDAADRRELHRGEAPGLAEIAGVTQRGFAPELLLHVRAVVAARGQNAAVGEFDHGSVDTRVTRAGASGRGLARLTCRASLPRTMVPSRSLSRALPNSPTG